MLVDLAGLLPSAMAWSRIYPGAYGAEVEIEIRQVFEPESYERARDRGSMRVGPVKALVSG